MGRRQQCAHTHVCVLCVSVQVSRASWNSHTTTTDNVFGIDFLVEPKWQSFPSERKKVAGSVVVVGGDCHFIELVVPVPRHGLGRWMYTYTTTKTDHTHTHTHLGSQTDRQDRAS